MAGNKFNSKMMLFTVYNTCLVCLPCHLKGGVLVFKLNGVEPTPDLRLSILIFNLVMVLNFLIDISPLPAKHC